MSVSKFTPAELEELRRADAEVDAEDTPLEYELDAELDSIAAAQASGKPVEQVIAKRKKNRSYYLENREARLAYTRNYNAEHKEAIRKYHREYYQKHKDKILEMEKEWRQKRKEKEKTSSENT